jgi:hypothetical protein
MGETMNRVLAVAVTAATATMVAGAAIAPAMAAARPMGARSAAAAAAKESEAKTVESRVKRAAVRPLAPLQIASQLSGGQYVTIVQCHGSVRTPPPIQVARPDGPLSVKGSTLSSGQLALLKKPDAYKTVYTCTVVVKERVQAKPKPRIAGHRACVVSGTGGGGRKSSTRCKKVTLNTGFGGLAAQVAQHHPAG